MLRDILKENCPLELSRIMCLRKQKEYLPSPEGVARVVEAGATNLQR